MSAQMMAAAWQVTAPPVEKLLLLKLADGANDDGLAAPVSVRMLAQWTGVSDRTIQRALRALEQRGWVSLEARGNGPFAYRVRLSVNEGGDNLSPPPGDNLSPVTICHPPGDARGSAIAKPVSADGAATYRDGVDARQVDEALALPSSPLVHPPVQVQADLYSESTESTRSGRGKGGTRGDGETSGAGSSRRSTLAERFARFWAAYPRKVAKQAAWRVWQRLKPDDALTARMIDAVGRQRASRQWREDGGRYIPHPATWLNQGRWEDEGDDGRSEADRRRLATIAALQREAEEAT